MQRNCVPEDTGCSKNRFPTSNEAKGMEEGCIRRLEQCRRTLARAGAARRCYCLFLEPSWCVGVLSSIRFAVVLHCACWIAHPPVNW